MMKDKNLQMRIEESLDFTDGEKEFIVNAIKIYEFVQTLTVTDLLKLESIPVED